MKLHDVLIDTRSIYVFGVGKGEYEIPRLIMRCTRSIQHSIRHRGVDRLERYDLFLFQAVLSFCTSHIQHTRLCIAFFHLLLRCQLL
jgi:hypothetical protein